MWGDKSKIRQQILKRAWEKPLTKSEMAELNNWLNRSEHHQAVADHFKDIDWISDQLKEMEACPVDKIWDDISTGIQDTGRVRRIAPKYWVAAAAVFLGIGIVTVLSIVGHSGKDQSLTKDNNPTSTPVTEMQEYTTAPRSAPYKKVLADGSTVWLSSTSTLRYPTAFAKGKREVELNGQATFDILPDKARPFFVKVNGIEVEVLGTYFDIMAYAGEPVSHISLFRGSVNVRYKDAVVPLHPMEQIVITEDVLKRKKITATDSIGLLGWRREEFRFDKADLMTIMQEVARWYGKTLRNKDKVAGIPITGKYGRDLSLQELLPMIEKEEMGHAFFKIENDTIDVLRTPYR